MNLRNLLQDINTGITMVPSVFSKTLLKHMEMIKIYT